MDGRAEGRRGGGEEERGEKEKLLDEVKGAQHKSDVCQQITILWWGTLSHQFFDNVPIKTTLEDPAPPL